MEWTRVMAPRIFLFHKNVIQFQKYFDKVVRKVVSSWKVGRMQTWKNKAGIMMMFWKPDFYHTLQKWDVIKI